MVKIETARKFTFDVGWVFVSLAVSMVVGLLVKIIIGNYYDASGLGAYSMVLTIWSMTVIFSELGIPVALIKYVAQYKDKGKIKDTFISTAMISGLILGVIAMIILFFSSYFLDRIFNIPNLGHLIRILSFCFPFVLINDMFVCSFNGLRMMKHYSIFEIYRRSAVLVFTVLFIWFGFGVDGAVLALVITPITVTGIVLAYHRKIVHFTSTGLKKYFRKLLRFGSQLYFSNAVTILNSQAAILLIGFYLTDIDVGVYSVVWLFFNVITLVSMAMQRITYPAITSYFAEKRTNSVKKLMEVSIRFSFIILSVFSLILFFFIDEGIALIFPNDPTFLLAVTPLKIILILGLLNGSVLSVSYVFAAAGRPDIFLKISIIQVTINLIIALLLIPSSIALFNLEFGGLNGATIALGISLLIGFILFIIYLKNSLKISLKINSILSGFLLFICVIGFGYILIFEVGLSDNIVGVLVIPIFLALMFIIKFIPKDEIQVLINMMKRKNNKNKHI